MEFDNLDTYSGDVEHDMWVDFDNYENTGIPDDFEETDYDNFIDNVNDWNNVNDRDSR